MTEKPRWLRLTSLNGNRVLIVVSKLSALAPQDEGGSEVWLQGDSEPMSVMEGPDEIVNLIDATERR